MRTSRRFLAGNRRTEWTFPFRALSDGHERKALLFQVFYIFVLFTSVVNFDVWDYHLTGPDISPLWPIFWIHYLSKDTSIFLILGLQLTSAFLGAFFCRWRFIRLLVFLSLLEYIALRGSYGKIGHSFHLLTAVAFFMIFLPNGWNSGFPHTKAIKAKTMVIFTACQFMIMMSYSLSGLGKIVMAFYQIALGQVNAFEPRALSLHVAQRLLETGDRSLIGPWLIDHSLYAWPMMQATLYLQFFAVLVVLRPSLHWLWAAGLIAFHIFSFFILTINFPYNCFLLGLFFLAENPFPSSPRRMLAQLPLFGMVIRRMFPKFV